MNNKFMSRWPATTARLDIGIAIFATLGTATTIGTGAWAFAAGFVGVWQLVAAGGLAIAGHGAVNAVARSGQGGAFMREIGTPAPQEMQQVVADIFAKAGLNYRPLVFITDSRREKEPGWFGRILNALFGRDRGILYDNSAFVLPAPTGPDRNTIMIGIGRNLAPVLTRSELIAVMAHETGHLIHASPGRHNVYSTASKLAAGLAVTSVLFMNFAALPVAVAGYAATRFLMARAGKYDEERADRTSAYLHPDRTALMSALGKVKDLIYARMCPDGPTFSYYRRRTQGFLFGAHPQVGTRLRYLERYTQEAETFHRENNIEIAVEAYRADAGITRGETVRPARKSARPGGVSPLQAAWKDEPTPQKDAPDDSGKADEKADEKQVRRPRHDGPPGPS